MWPTVVTAASPAVKTRGFRSTGTPLASASRALAPAIRTTARPSDSSLIEARFERSCRSNFSKELPSPPSVTASQCPGPAQTKASDPRAARRDVVGRSSPKTARTRLVSASPAPLRTMTAASARSARSESETPGSPFAAPYRPGIAIPWRAEQGLRSVLATQSFSLRVDEARCADLDFDVIVAHWVDSPHAPANPFRPAGQQSQANPMPQRRRERDGGHHSLVIIGARWTVNWYEMGAGAKASTLVRGFEAGKGGPIGIEQRRAIRHDPADVVFPCRHQFGQAEVPCRGTTIDLVAGNVSFLDAHDTEGLGAIWCYTEACTNLHQRSRECVSKSCGHRDLVGTLTGKRDAEEAGRNPAQGRQLCGSQVRKCYVRNVERCIDDAG